MTRAELKKKQAQITKELAEVREWLKNVGFAIRSHEEQQEQLLKLRRVVAICLANSKRRKRKIIKRRRHK